MASRQRIVLQSPIGGVNRRLDFQSQPPFTTPFAMNVRSRSLSDRRTRVARREGMVKHSATRIGTLSYETTGWGEPYTSADFATDGWTLANTTGGVAVRIYDGAPPYSSFYNTAPAGATKYTTAWRALPADLVATQSYTIAMYCNHNGNQSSEIYLYAGIDSVTEPESGTANLAYVKASLFNNIVTIQLYKVVAGTHTAIGAPATFDTGGVWTARLLTLTIDGTTAYASFATASCTGTLPAPLGTATTGYRVIPRETVSSPVLLYSMAVQYQKESNDLRNVRLIGNVSSAQSSSVVSWIEPYTSTSFVTDGWSTAAGASAYRDVPNKRSQTAFGTVLQLTRALGTFGGFNASEYFSVRLPFSLNAASDFVELRVADSQGGAGGVLGSGVAIHATKTGGYAQIYVGGWVASTTALPASYVYSAGAALELRISGTAISWYYNNVLLGSDTIAGSPVWSHFGVTLSSASGAAEIRQVEMDYTATSIVGPRRIMLFAAGQNLYRQLTPTGTVQELTTPTTNRTVAKYKSLSGAELAGDYYIADHAATRLTTAVTDGVVAADYVSLTSATVTGLGNWAAIGTAAADTAIDILSDVVTLTKGNIVTSHEIASIAGPTLTLATRAAPNSGYTVKIERCIKKVDPDVGSYTNLMSSSAVSKTITGTTGTTIKSAHGIFSDTQVGESVVFVATLNTYVISKVVSSTEVQIVAALETADAAVDKYIILNRGVVPTNCAMIAQQWGRIIVAGDSTTAIYASAIADPTKFLYGDEMAGSASAWGGPAETRAVIGLPPTALCPFGDDSLVIGTYDALFAYRGDPGSGGTMASLSRIVGIIGKKAWCSTPDGYLVFLTRKNGLMVIPPGALFTSGDSSVAQSFSDEMVPAELRNIDPTSYDVQLIYDPAKDFIRIYLTPNSTGTALHWVVDWKTKAFWADSNQSDHGPTAVGYDTEQAVLIGGRDGYLRKYSDTADTDDGSTVTGTCQIGPFTSARPGQDGAVADIVGTLTEESAAVTWKLYVGQTPQLALNAAAFATGTWAAGLNYSTRPQARGPAAILEVTGSGRWEFDSAVVETSQAGVLRKS